MGPRPAVYHRPAPDASGWRRSRGQAAHPSRRSAFGRAPQDEVEVAADVASIAVAADTSCTTPSRISGAVPPQSLIFAELLGCPDPGRGSQLHGDASPLRDVDRPTAA